MRGFLAVLLVAAAVGHAPAAAAPRLAQETSPYLRLHAKDAVDWRPWGEAAFAEARRDQKPILLAIGYFACRWCHVMQRESYLDPAIAEIIHRNFIPVLVDREERPDVDAAYILQASLLGLPTGWPLTLFLAPSGEVFFGGTYYPKVETGGVPSFAHVLREAATAWREDPAALTAEAARAADALRRALAPRLGTLGAGEIDSAQRALLEDIDPFHGGFGKSTKFPRAPALEALWRAYLRTGKKDFAEAVAGALTAMAEGGLYDHVGGGFFRYTVDPEWRVPHYEKMLNVNGVLLALFTEIWRETREARFARQARETAAFLLAEMRLPSGAFASALDAESADATGHKDEGTYYLWSETELRRVLGADADPFLAAYGLAPPERRELRTLDDPGTLYRSETAEERFDASLARLRAEREARARPARDDKLLANWNGIAIAALAEAGFAFGEQTWIEAARLAFADAVRRLESPSGRLAHSWHDGRAGAPAPVESLAQMARAALVLFEATGDAAYLRRAETWVGQAISDHWDPAGGGFFQAVADVAPALTRLKPVIDMPDPSGNATMVEVLAKLYFLTGAEDLRARAERTLATTGGIVGSDPLSSAGLLNAADSLRQGLQVVIVGQRGEAGAERLLVRTLAFSLPARALLVIPPGQSLPDNHPAHGKGQIDGRATAYVCRGTVCSLPAADENELAETIRAMRAGL
ncbi:MAG: thioredoxin domain-containing protein [Acidimicrobiia bacterium]|nr:thioredoxin domain-containing protein [Acidimicrobiia bacterium]